MSKKTGRNMGEICNTFQYVVGEESGETEFERKESEFGSEEQTEKVEPREDEKETEDDQFLAHFSVEQSFEVSSKELVESPTAERVETSTAAEGSSNALDLSGKVARKCAAKFEGSLVAESSAALAARVPAPARELDDTFEFVFDEADPDELMRRVTFRMHDYRDAIPKRVFLDPWVRWAYSGEEIICAALRAGEEGTIREVPRRYIYQPWRQYKGEPFSYTQEADIFFILPSGKIIVVPMGYVSSQVKTTSLGSIFMEENEVRVRLSRNSGKGTITIVGEEVACELIRAGPVRPGAPWAPLGSSSQPKGGGFAQYRLDKARSLGRNS